MLGRAVALMRERPGKAGGSVQCRAQKPGSIVAQEALKEGGIAMQKLSRLIDAPTFIDSLKIPQITQGSLQG